MSELPPAVSPQPTAPELAAWLAEHESSLAVESDGEGLRVRFIERPAFSDERTSRRLALTGARALMESAACPWRLAADGFTEDGQQTPLGSGEGLFTLLVRAVTPEESAARREARTRARRHRAATAQEANAATRAEGEAIRQRWPAPTPRPQAAPPTVDRPVRPIDAGELPVLGYAHAPDHYHGHTEPQMFRALGPDPVVRGPHPERGAGLWTSPAVEQDDDGTVLVTVWSQWYATEYPGEDHYCEHLRIVPNPTARIVLIDNRQDLLALVQQYPNPPAGGALDDSPLFPNWPEVAGEWDAVYLTADGARATDTQDPDTATEPHLYGWTGATVVWLNPAYTVADGLGL
ncbi:hypothetical protein [Streptacidiphilus sp. EB103A]|uniref:hypothetical protein n=1 Tax=Streptacidiphilus sp. EB103A TaxID=3156275 RepID=UPI0035112FCF